VLTLRLGFRIEPGEKPMSWRMSSRQAFDKETMEVVLKAGAVVLAAGSLIDRSGGRTDLGVPRVAWLYLMSPLFRRKVPLMQDRKQGNQARQSLGAGPRTKGYPADSRFRRNGLPRVQIQSGFPDCSGIAF